MATDAEGNEGAGKVRYLGSGDNAIIRPGVVLVVSVYRETIGIYIDFDCLIKVSVSFPRISEGTNS